MKIAHIFHEYPSTYQHYLSKLIELMKFDFGDSVVTINYDSRSDFSEKSFLKAHFLIKLSRWLGGAKRTEHFNNYLKKFDIIHFQHSYLFRRSLDFRNSNKTKVIITLRGKDTYLKPWVQKEWREFLKHNEVSAFVVVSNHQKDYLSSRWHVDSKRIFVVPVSVTLPERFSPVRLSKNEIAILSTVRFTWEKNIKTTLYVIQELKKGAIIRNSRFVVMGIKWMMKLKCSFS